MPGRGHSSAEMREGVLFFNPGSAGPRRFRLPISVGRLDVQEGRIEATIVDLGRDTAVRGEP